MTEYTQHPSEILDYTADFAGHCVRFRDMNADYPADTAVQPRRGTGLQYRTAAGGRTGSSEPQWPTTTDRNVVDGSVLWSAEPVSTDSLARTLSSAVWTADPGITVTPLPISGTRITALLSGGEAGRDYAVKCVATCSDGTKPVRAFTLQVRA